jgi:hypothetical protein
MATENAKDRRLMGYLVGQLSETERAEVEDRYFADDALFEYLAAIESEVIDAYVRGELPEPDRLRRFLGSARLRARIALARRLHERTIQMVGVATTTLLPVAAESSSGRGTPKPAAVITPTNRVSSPVVGAIAAGVIVAAAVAGWWMFRSSRPAVSAVAPVAIVAPLPVSRPAPAPEPPLTRERLTPSATGPVALVLAPGSVASRDGGAMLVIPDGADVVRIQVDHDGPPRERYAVIVSTRSGLRVWAESKMAARAPDAKGVVCQIPAESLAPGDYLVTLSGGALQARRLQAVADYSLRVR